MTPSAEPQDADFSVSELGQELLALCRCAGGELGLSAAAWVLTVRQMHGMDMDVATPLGSIAFFVALWVAMMAAMMPPGAAPAVLSRARATGPVRAVVPFVASYLAVWTLVGALVYAVYRPHGSAVAGALVIAAGIYDLTRLKQHCRRCCRAGARSGFGFGLYSIAVNAFLFVPLQESGEFSREVCCVSTDWPGRKRPEECIVWRSGNDCGYLTRPRTELT